MTGGAFSGVSTATGSTGIGTGAAGGVGSGGRVGGAEAVAEGIEEVGEGMEPVGVSGAGTAGAWADWVTCAVVCTLGFEPAGGVRATGAAAVFMGWMDTVSFLISGVCAPGMTRRGRFSSTTGAGNPVLSGGEGTASFSMKYLSASRADSGLSEGCRLMCHMIQSQAQSGMPSRTSWRAVT